MSNPVKFYLTMRDKGVHLLDILESDDEEARLEYMVGFLMHWAGYTEEGARDFLSGGRDAAAAVVLVDTYP